MDTVDPRPLNLNDSYPCPVCRHGKIQSLVLTDAFACEFCRHILSADLPQQQVQVVDGPQAITWIWNGERWRVVGRSDGEVSAFVLSTATVLIVLPAALVWLAGVIFPPLSPSTQMAFPTFWAIVTFAAHLVLVLWLVGEYYQIPFYVAIKVQLLRRRFTR